MKKAAVEQLPKLLTANQVHLYKRFQSGSEIPRRLSRKQINAYWNLLSLHTSSHISDTDHRYASVSVARFSFFLLNISFSNPAGCRKQEKFINSITQYFILWPHTSPSAQIFLWPNSLQISTTSTPTL